MLNVDKQWDITDEMENTTVVYKAQNVLLYYSW
jgi:hypothetical protein